ncbi:unnamed protein product [Peronospora destructor]|uniref:SCP domain-containing protein n=1 Tax=Peronospora destructor TaxID=86335 RepID=A0AAV0U682_9STRA|nr:unnamed protein product [Peronospora destructor]CAI5732497.1 unnamed protein product [Peronospora destructor]
MKPFAPLNVLTLTALVGCVNAHGYISQPRAKYEPSPMYTGYNCLTNASINEGFAGGIYNHEPENNAKQFAEHWNATGYTSLREMLDPIAPDYGYSIATGDPVDVSSYTEMWWQNNEYKEGFLKSHYGPCETWIDETMVFHSKDCAKEFRSYPAKIPIDYSACKPGKKCLLVFYWLALHSPQWQIYKQCVPISNEGSGKSSAKGATTDITAPKGAPTTPKVTLPATPPVTPPATLTTDFTSIKTTGPASAPAIVTSSPATVTSSPATVTSSPATVTSSPATVTSSPATVTSSPATVTSSPATVTSSPATVTNTPAAVTSTET